MFAVLWGVKTRRSRVCAPALRRAALALAMALCAGLAAAQEADEVQDGELATGTALEAAAKEIWSGTETSHGAWAFYTGLTVVPGGFAVPGLRYRLAAGMSSYRYVDALGSGRAAQPFADLLVGYQWQFGGLTLKAFAGASGHADIRSLEQALDPWAYAHFGGKASVETWWTIDARNWAALDVSYASPQAALWSRARIGHRLLPQLSVGPETGLAGDVSKLAGRLGAFARFDWESGEVAVAGGVAGAGGTSRGGDSDRRDRASAPYLTLLWLQRF